MKKAKKTPTKSENPAYRLVLQFNDKELKQLETAHKITGEKTATKAIIKCLYLADYYLKENNSLMQRLEAIERNLFLKETVIQDYFNALGAMQKIKDLKPEKISKNVQMRIPD